MSRLNLLLYQPNFFHSSHFGIKLFFVPGQRLTEWQNDDWSQAKSKVILCVMRVWGQLSKDGMWVRNNNHTIPASISLFTFSVFLGEMIPLFQSFLSLMFLRIYIYWFVLMLFFLTIGKCQWKIKRGITRIYNFVHLFQSIKHFFLLSSFHCSCSKSFFTTFVLGVCICCLTVLLWISTLRFCVSMSHVWFLPHKEGKWKNI